MHDLQFRIAVAILAGGRGERLGGVNKALLELGGRRMIDWVIAAVAPVAKVLVCAGPNQILGAFAGSIPDLDTPYGGPLAGLAAAVDALSDDPPDWLLTVAADTPFFPTDFINRALLLAESVDAVMSAYDRQDYPTNALWRFRAVAGLSASVRNGSSPHSLKRLAGGLRLARLDYAQVLPQNPFANANTPDELEALRERAKTRKPA